MAYRVEGLSEKGLIFEGLNDWANAPSGEETKRLPLIEAGVRIHIVEVDDRLRIMLEVGENTIHDELRAAIPLAIEWRNRLLEWQGPWDQGGDNFFYEYLHREHKRGISYAMIAELINRKLADRLVEYADFLEEYEQVAPQLHSYSDFFLWAFGKNRRENVPNPFSLDHARDVLELMKLPSNEIELLLQTGMERIKAGERPFEDGYPISRENVISILRTWRSGKKFKVLREMEDRWLQEEE